MHYSFLFINALERFFAISIIKNFCREAKYER